MKSYGKRYENFQFETVNKKKIRGKRNEAN